VAVRWVSGLMVRFSYRVINAEKAKALNDKKENPYLLDERAHVKLWCRRSRRWGSCARPGHWKMQDLLDGVLQQRSVCEGWRSGSAFVIGKFRVDGLVVE